MARWTRTIVVFVVALLVVAACGVSFADATVTTDPCGPGKGWAFSQVDPSSSAKALPEVPIILVGVADVSEAAPRWAAVEDTVPAPSGIVLAQPRAPRAPPLF